MASDDLNKLQNNIQTLLERLPDFVAEQAVFYFKDRFRTKEWNGKPWKPAKCPPKKGSLLLRNRLLRDSIRPKLITKDKVIITAGNQKVKYARTHNEGLTVHPRVTEKMRKFAWAKYYKASKSRKKDNCNNPALWKGIALTKNSRLTIKIPKRQFMGNSPHFRRWLINEINIYLDKNLKS